MRLFTRLRQSKKHAHLIARTASPRVSPLSPSLRSRKEKRGEPLRINIMKIEIINGDITTLKVDAIVNAANKELSHGGGVCGAIHDQAGQSLAKECGRLSRRLGGVLPGEAFITGGYELPAHHVIHTLGPVWRACDAQAQAGLRSELAACYTNSLAVAEEHELASIAFPSIGTGFLTDRTLSEIF